MMSYIWTQNPANQENIREYKFLNQRQCLDKLNQSYTEFLRYKQKTFSERKQLLLNVEKILLAKKEFLSKLMTQEMGKPINASRAEIEKSAWVIKYFAENAEAFLEDQIIKTEAKKSYVHMSPMGVFLAIMPWNFPYWQVFRFAAPCLMAGNSFLLKHAANVAGTAEEIEKIFQEVGYAKNLVSNILVNHSDIEPIIAHPKLAAVTLTGSTRAGKEVAALCGKYLKKSILELGGNDSYLVLEDANLTEAAQLTVSSRMINSGQSCIAAKRIFIHKKNHEQFLKLVVTELEKFKFEDPTLDTCMLGPLARLDLRDQLHQQVTESISKGAKLILGGVIPQGKGFYYPATLLDNVKPQMPAFEDELFGPVYSLITCESDEECLNLANQSHYGLGGGIFSKNIEKAELWARDYFESGACFINDFTKSDPRLPFGGIKQSGYGREMSSFGIKELVNIKTIQIK